MDSDKVENSEEANTFEGAHGYSKETKENSHIDANNPLTCLSLYRAAKKS